MNAFGIDYGRALSVVCLRDGQGLRSRTRLVGDGFRSAIPHAVRELPASSNAPVLWGSRALEIEDKDSVSRPLDSSSGPWLESPGAALFWQGLMSRLTTYIGRVKPLPDNGYELVAAIQSDNYEHATEEMKKLCREGGFDAVTVVPAPHALLSRWMMEVIALPSGTGARTVATVCVGDNSIALCAYRVMMRGAQLPEVHVASRCFFIGECGATRWTNRLLQEVANRWREMPDRSDEMALRDAATEFGARLGRASQSEQIEWDGPLAERMFESLRLSRRECRDWEEVAPLRDNLPALLQRAALAVAGNDNLDLIVVGGVGAMWPFAGEAAEKYGPVWQSGFPLEDVARGAAYWSETGGPNLAHLHLDGSASGFGLSSLPSSLLSANANNEDEGANSSQLLETNIPPDFFGTLLENTASDGDVEAVEEESEQEVEEDIPPSQRWRMNQ